MNTLVTQHVHMNENFTWSEQGLGDLFYTLYYDRYCYSSDEPQWMYYHDGKWNVDVNEVELGKSMQTFYLMLLDYAKKCAEDEEYIKFVGKLGATRMQEAVKKAARYRFSKRSSEFDKDGSLLNCENGVLNLENGTFRPHDWHDYITKIANVKYEKGVRSDRWERFIREVTEDDQEKADYLQRALGYSLLGGSYEDCMFIIHGRSTRNGKSTLMDTLNWILNDYASVIDAKAICKSMIESGVETASPMVASLKGVRFVTMSEPDANARLDEATIKKYTGGEEIYARALFKQGIRFRPQFTMWMTCNDLPRVCDKSLFSSERLRVIEFNRHFSELERDKNLRDELREGASGILTWLIEGLKRYRESGLEMNAAMKEVMLGYEKENDTVVLFLEECCKKELEGGMTATALYNAYKYWARENGYFVMTAQRFSREMSKHPEWYYGKSKTMQGWKYNGLVKRSMISLATKDNI